MAKYEITYTCGHVETVQLYGPEKDRERKIAWLNTCLCPDCYRAQQTANAAKKAAESGLPELTGSEKQIAWAITLRDKALQKLDDFRAELVAHNQGKDVMDAFNEIEASVKTQVEARWWIDRRDYTAPAFVREYRRG